MEIVSKAVPPAEILATEKLLETDGLDGVTGSLSLAEQTPAKHDTPSGLVLVTLAGGEITAVLVTWVWPWTDETAKTSRHSPAKCTSDNRAKQTKRDKDM